MHLLPKSLFNHFKVVDIYFLYSVLVILVLERSEIGLTFIILKISE
jgi:hypothetical protein